MKRVGEQLPLARVLPCRVRVHKVIEGRLVVRPEQVANEQDSAGGAHPMHLGQTTEWLGNVVNDAVRDYGAEALVRVAELLGVRFLNRDAAGETGLAYVPAGQRQHVVGHINRE